MIPKGLFTQIAMVIFSIAIVFTYLKPTFSEIQSIQADIKKYETEEKKVQDVNSLLATLVTKMEGVSSDNKQRLETYMPDEVDIVSIQRDLVQITEAAGLIYEDSGEGEQSNSSNNNRSRRSTSQNASATDGENNKPNAHQVSLNVTGEYDQIKELFSLIEQNNYPLEVRSVNIASDENGLLSATINMATYSYNNAAIAETTN